MARRNQRKRPPRRRTAQKRFFRRTEHIANRQVMQCRLPADPPPVTRGIDICLKLQVCLVGDPKATKTGFDSYGDSMSPALYKLKIKQDGTVARGAIGAFDICKLVDAYIGYAPSNCYTEMAIMKVSLWGPSQNQGLFTGNATSFLVVDPGANYASRSVTDVGTATNRPRCGLSIPEKVWFCAQSASGTEFVITFNPDTTPSAGTDKSNTRWPLDKGAFDLGVLHVTVHYKHCAVPLSVE